MVKFRVGVQLQPQHTSVASLAQAAQRIEALGADTIFLWDHFFPLSGDADGKHFEAWTLLSAVAAQTRRAEVGILVTCNSYRNPNLLADMARTVDHISNGRLILGIGSGWFDRDYNEYGYPFGTARSRLQALEEALPVIQKRLSRLNPPPMRDPLPILIGGSGEKVTLRIVARFAHLWNMLGEPEEFQRKNALLDGYCRELGRNPAEIERTIAFGVDEMEKVDAYRQAGATHMILCIGEPWDLAALESLLRWRQQMG